MESHYPESCPFCKIAATYPVDPTAPVPRNPDPDLLSPSAFPILSTPLVMAFLDIMPISPGHVLLTTREHYEKLTNIPTQSQTKTGPPSKSLWTKPYVPEGDTPSKALGFWMPVLSRALAKTLDIEDWNVVQNNGARAAQVVPHVHFHFIPRYPEGRKELGGKGAVDVGMLKSWRMFGRGTREDLDEDDARQLSEKLREGLRAEIQLLERPREKL